MKFIGNTEQIGLHNYGTEKKNPGVAESENIRTDILYKFHLLVTPL